MTKIENEKSQAHIAKVHKTLYQYKNDYLKSLMEDKTMVIILIAYLKENGL